MEPITITLSDLWLSLTGEVALKACADGSVTAAYTVKNKSNADGITARVAIIR